MAGRSLPAKNGSLANKCGKAGVTLGRVLQSGQGGASIKVVDRHTRLWKRTTQRSKRVLVCLAWHLYLGPECQAVIDIALTAMAKGDEGGEAAVHAKEKGPERVDMVGENVNEAGVSHAR